LENLLLLHPEARREDGVSLVALHRQKDDHTNG
jgi:hypothetical protein